MSLPRFFKIEIKSQWVNYLIIYGLVVLIFVIDASTPTGFALSTLFTLPMYLAARPSSRAKIFPLLVICTILIFGAVLLKRPAVPNQILFFNRISGIVSIWILSLIIILNRKYFMEKVHEIEHRKTVEKQLRDREIFLSSIFRSVPVGIGLVRNRVFLFMNESLTRLTGYSAHELEGKNTRILYPDEDEYLRAAGIYVRLRNELVAAFEAKWKRKNGEVFDVLLVLSPLDVKDPSRGFIFSALDVTERNRAERELRESERRFHQMINSNIIGITITSSEGVVLDANDYFLELIGGSREDLNEGRLNWNEVTPAEYLPLDRKAREEMLKSGSCEPFEKEYVRPDGSRVSVLLTGTMVSWKHTEAGAFFVLDITESRKVAEKLQESESFLQEILTSSLAGIYIYDLEKNKIMFINTQYSSITGYTREEMNAKPTREFMELFHPEDRERVRSHIKAVAQMAGDAIEEIEYRFRTKDGRWMWFLSRERVFKRAPNGRVRQYIGSFIDIDSRKHAEEELGRQKRKFEALAESTPDVIFILDAQMRYQYINLAAEKLSGIPRGKFLGKTAKEVGLPESSSRAWEECFRKSVETGKTCSSESEYPTKQGDTRILYNVNVPFFAGDGTFEYVLGYSHDITDLKKSQEILRRDKETVERLVKKRTQELLSARFALERARRLSDIGALAATVAHELRNPLAVIKAAMYNISKKCKDEHVEPHVRNIEKKMAQSEEIINNLLFYSRLRQPQYESVDPYVILHEIDDFMLHRFSDLKLEEQLGEIRGVKIEADATQLSELFSNILNNAHDAVKDTGGKVMVRGRVENGSLRFEVSDEGVGMDNEELKKLFTPFYTTKSKGTGLGLTVSNQIVKLHNGKLNIKSEKGKGTTVTIDLPRHP